MLILFGGNPGRSASETQAQTTQQGSSSRAAEPEAKDANTDVKAEPSAGPTRETRGDAPSLRASRPASEPTARAAAGGDDARRGAAAASLAELSSSEAAGAREAAEAAVQQARRSAVMDRVTMAADAPATSPLSGALDGGMAGASEGGSEGLARDVATLRAMEEPSPEPAVDRRA